MNAPTPDAIRAWRRAAGLSAAAAAALVHVSARTWLRWESGDSAMPLACWELANIKARP